MKPEGLIAGFDAGQTHTTCRLAEAHSGRIVAEGQGPGVSHLAAAQGPQRFQDALRLSLAAALAQLPPAAGSSRLPPPATRSPSGARAVSRDPTALMRASEHRLAPPPPRGDLCLQAAAIGASGIELGTAVQGQGLALAAAALALRPERLWVGGDERTALRGAFPQGPGIVVISGTGTIAVGRDGAGREQRCAGWGWILDQGGSAFDIGRDGLALSLEMADGRRPPTELLQRLWQGLALDPVDPLAPQAIKARVVTPGFVPAGLARLAPLVEQAAAAGDGEALAILGRHAEALAASVAAVAGALALEAPPVAALGGAITHLPLFRLQFQRSLARLLPASHWQEPAGDALSGALAIAAERLRAAALQG